MRSAIVAALPLHPVPCHLDALHSHTDSDVCKLGEGAACPAAPADLEPIELLIGELGSNVSA